jgi:hypothetical protein
MSEQIQPGDGYRLLGPDDVVREGDEFCAFNSFVWEEVAESFIGEKGQSTRIRRRIPAKPEPECIGGTSYYCDSNWAAIRETQDTYGILVTKAASARKLADWLARYADWREAQDAAK